MTLKNDLEAKKAIFGRDVILKRIKKSEIKTVYVASNCPGKDEVVKNCKANDIECIEMKENSKEVGIICKKPFNIAVVGF